MRLSRSECGLTISVSSFQTILYTSTQHHFQRNHLLGKSDILSRVGDNLIAFVLHAVSATWLLNWGHEKKVYCNSSL